MGHAQDYKTFLDIRNFEPAGVLPGRMETGKSLGSAGLTASITCHERGVDVSLRCSQCIRLIKGGPYGARGVAVDAYPQQDDVVPCLELSRNLPKYEPLPGERFDG